MERYFDKYFLKIPTIVFTLHNLFRKFVIKYFMGVIFSGGENKWWQKLFE